VLDPRCARRVRDRHHLDLDALSRYLSSPLGTNLARAGALATSDNLCTLRHQFWEQRFAAVRTVIDRAIARGEIAPDIDVRPCLEVLVAPLHMRVVLTGEPLDRLFVERLVEVILSGIAPAHSGASKAIPGPNREGMS
jgi:hypothetical protein